LNNTSRYSRPKNPKTLTRKYALGGGNEECLPMFRHAKKWFVRSRTIGRAFAIICGYEASNISIARMLLMGVADIYEALWDEQAK
jgi:hypothetical protein